VAAHPFRWGQPFDEILRDEQPDLDGIEVMTHNMDAPCRQRAAAILKKHPFAGLGSSDAHQIDVLGICYTEFDAKIHNGEDLAQAIRCRRLRARERLRQREPVSP
jgi:hypothetical protein